MASKGFYQFKIQLPRPQPRVPRRTPVNVRMTHVESGEAIKSYRSVEVWGIDNDLHATLLHLLGIDHEKLTYRFNGRDYRLTDIAGNIIKPLLA